MSPARDWMTSMKSVQETLHSLAPFIIAGLLIIVCFVLLLCGKDGAFKNILATLVGYFFGQASRRNSLGDG